MPGGISSSQYCSFQLSLQSDPSFSPTVLLEQVIMKKKVNNMKRDQERRMVNIKKKVNEYWTKFQNPNMFGGCPVLDNTGKIAKLSLAPASAQLSRLS